MKKFFTLFLLLCSFGPRAHASSTLPDTLSGVVKGVTSANHTYVVKDSLVVNVGDTLLVSSGDTLLMASPLGWIHIFGTFICDGNSTSRNVITVPASRGAMPGLWGGIVGDSCKYIEVRFTNILWAGGNDAGGHAYRTFDIYSDFANTTTTVFTDNYVVGTVDDCIGLHGGNASVLRNVIKWCGAPDGDNINVKSGTIGEIAYNVIWASGGNGIKLNADATLPRLTNMCIHNNTVVAGGWRRVGELGYAIVVDKSARAQIYNNIMGDMYQELEITNKADTTRTVYDNNLFFYSADSLNNANGRYYPSDGIGHPAAHDVIDVMAANLFKNYHPYFTNDYTALDGSNDYRILSTSAAAGHGFTPPAPTGSNHWGNPYFGNGATTLPGDANIGALGLATVAGIGAERSALATSYALGQNYPNPFNPSTVITYQIPAGGTVRVSVFDLLGREVMKLLDEEQSPGLHAVTFEAGRLPSGTYLYRIQAGPFTAVKKMVLMK